VRLRYTSAFGFIRTPAVIVTNPVHQLSAYADHSVSVQSALKHSWPQKSDPRMPSLSDCASVRTRPVEGVAEDTDLLQVGHSRREGGLPCGHFELWQGTSPALIILLRGGGVEERLGLTHV
jgi:hypothetical protein